MVCCALNPNQTGVHLMPAPLAPRASWSCPQTLTCLCPSHKRKRGSWQQSSQTLPEKCTHPGHDRSSWRRTVGGKKEFLWGLPRWNQSFLPWAKWRRAGASEKSLSSAWTRERGKVLSRLRQRSSGAHGRSARASICRRLGLVDPLAHRGGHLSGYGMPLARCIGAVLPLRCPLPVLLTAQLEVLRPS